MEKLMTIKGIFNDVFTGYKDKEETHSFIVDDEKDCTCTDLKKCWMHRNPDIYILSDLPTQLTK
jgi:hypothetical protein